jgi:hypothetical protein
MWVTGSIAEAICCRQNITVQEKIRLAPKTLFLSSNRCFTKLGRQPDKNMTAFETQSFHLEDKEEAIISVGVSALFAPGPGYDLEWEKLIFLIKEE